MDRVPRVGELATETSSLSRAHVACPLLHFRVAVYGGTCCASLAQLIAGVVSITWHSLASKPSSSRQSRLTLSLSHAWITPVRADSG